MIADTNGCSKKCDYRGSYGADKCLSGCGKPSQRFYHVPRSFLNSDTNSNTLILFEEMGGSPFNVSVQTITIGSICATAVAGQTLELKCPDGKTFSKVEFASYGDKPRGKCGSFQRGRWEASASISVVENLCIGKQSCSIFMADFTFNLNIDVNIYLCNGKHCGIDAKFAVQLQCDERVKKNLHKDIGSEEVSGPESEL
jgi:hypothetical protein